MAGVFAGGVVVVFGTDGNNAAIARQGDSTTAVVIRCFAVDVAAALHPVAAIPGEDAGVA